MKEKRYFKITIHSRGNLNTAYDEICRMLAGGSFEEKINCIVDV